MSQLRTPATHVLPAIVSQHCEEAILVRLQREELVEAPHVRLTDLARFDERLAAHLDALDVAGDEGWRCCEGALAEPSSAAAFVAAAHAIVSKHRARLDQLMKTGDHSSSGVIHAGAWLSGEYLRGIVAHWLNSPDPVTRRVALEVCVSHGVDVAAQAAEWTRDPAPAIPPRGFRALGVLGARAFINLCVSGLSDENDECQFWATWSAVLLGERNRALHGLARLAMARGPYRVGAFRLAMQVMNFQAGHAFLKTLAADPARVRDLIEGSGIAGDPQYIPWLIGHMRHEHTARVAGEAFSQITGADMALGLDCPQPQDFESGPNDNPDDDNVEMDPDEGLPWPDPAKVEQWWMENRSRFRPGQRYFMGAPVTREHCIDVLKNGYQRQRILAAHYLCLLEPGTPLFNTSAPAWRQQRLLARM